MSDNSLRLQHCTVHGFRCIDDFFPDDIRYNRHRCKKCVRKKIRQWRRSNPLKTSWSRFVQRVKRRFSGVQLSWKEHGEACIERLLKENPHMKDFDPLHWVITWKSGAQEFDINQLQLLTRSEALCRPKARLAVQPKQKPMNEVTVVVAEVTDIVLAEM